MKGGRGRGGASKAKSMAVDENRGGRGAARSAPYAKGKTGRNIATAAAGRGRGAKTAGAVSSGNRGSFNVVIMGVPENTPLAELRAWLNGNMNSPIRWQSLAYEGNKAVMTVGTRGEAIQVSKITGKMFNGSKLTARVTSHAHPNQTTILREKTSLSAQQQQQLAQRLQNAFQPNGGLLDLRSLSKDPSVSNLNIDFNNPSIGRIFEFIGKHAGSAVVTLSLQDNNIATLVHLANLGKHFPNLENLSLEDNLIQSITELDHLRRIKLKWLVLKNNPVTTKDNYVKEVRNRFRSLENLDMQDLPPLETRASDAGTMSSSVNLPAELPPFSPDPSITPLVESFITRYLATYDGSDRNALEAAYAPDAMFSLTVSGGSKDLKNTNKMMHKAWMRWVNEDRNHWYRGGKTNANAIGGFLREDLDKINSLVRTPRSLIVQTLCRLPIVEHDLKSFIGYDACLLPGGNALLLTLHGVLTEKSPSNNNNNNNNNKSGGIQRSYTRVFVLLPQPAGGSWPALIQSDQWHVRFAPSAKTVKKGGGGGGSGGGSSAGVPAVAGAPAIGPEAMEIVKMVMNATGVTDPQVVISVMQQMGPSVSIDAVVNQINILRAQAQQQ